MRRKHRSPYLALAVMSSLVGACSKAEEKSAEKSEQSTDTAAVSTSGLPAAEGKPVATSDDAQSAGGSEPTKRYEIESGTIEYKQDGMQVGTERLMFRRFGGQEFREAKVKINIQGLPAMARAAGMSSENHSLTLIDGDTTYSWDPKTKQGTKLTGTLDVLGGSDNQRSQGDMRRLGLEMIESMGGSKTGTKEILGHTCNVWDVPKLGGTVCEYKGVPLESKVTMMGMNQHTLATKVSFGDKLPETVFEVPEGVKLREMNAKQMLRKGVLKDGIDPATLDKIIQAAPKAKPQYKIAE